ncbi:MAG: hypothetical protein SF123_15160 [Chloroflexota bacterium]|nr:hypothetical protein [Chloroflexota bacterium]
MATETEQRPPVVTTAESPQFVTAPSEMVKTEAVHEEKHFEPKGAFFFVLLMLLGYALYFAFVWFQVFIERGGA